MRYGYCALVRSGYNAPLASFYFHILLIVTKYRAWTLCAHNYPLKTEIIVMCLCIRNHIFAEVVPIEYFSRKLEILLLDLQSHCFNITALLCSTIMMSAGRDVCR